MFRYWRTGLYLAAAGVIWFAEGVVFSMALHFGLWQITVVTLYFLALFIAAFRFVIKTLAKPASESADGDAFPATRILAMMPVLTLLLGSFAALPVFLLLLVLGAAS